MARVRYRQRRRRPALQQFAEEFTALVDKAMQRMGRELEISPDDLVRVILALHEGALIQFRLEPEDLATRLEPA